MIRVQINKFGDETEIAFDDEYNIIISNAALDQFAKRLTRIAERDGDTSQVFLLDPADKSDDDDEDVQIDEYIEDEED